MRTRDRPNFEKNKKLVRTTTISVALFVAAIMIFSTIPTMASPETTTKLIEKAEDQLDIQGDPTGLDPTVENNMKVNALKSTVTQPFGPLSDDGYMYACDALDFDVARWPLDDPSSIENIADGDNLYFLAGGDWTCDEEWFGCEYNTGGLWKIDPDTGEMTQIGGGGTSVNGLAWDPVYNRLYGLGSGGLYEYDPETGEQEYIGSTGVSDAMICMFIDMDGVAWSYDVKFTGNAKLYNVDLGTGACTEYCDMGQNLLYAQDGAYDRDTETLYLAAYSGGGFFGYWDWDAQEIVTLGNLDSEYACAMIRSPCIPPEHDVGVKAILKPEASGHAVPQMEMELLVKNYGANPETFDAQMEIIKCESSGDYLLEEHFDGATFPPENWSTDYWTKSYTNYANGESPEARMYKYDQYYGGQYYDNYIMTSPVDATGWEKILMNFRWAFEVYSSYGQYCNFYVKYRKNDTSPWKDVSPWANPLGQSYEGDYYTIDCYGFGGDLGDGFQVMFQYIGYYYYYNYIYLDDITIEGCGGCAEYAELEKDITLDPGQEATVVFPGWQPSEWHNESYQDDWETYPVHGFTIFDEDQRPKNNDKWMLLELYYPWFYDIEVTEIGEPKEDRSMPARTFDVEATMTNVGQFPMCCIPIDVAIGEPYIADQLFYEADWPGSGTYYPGEYSGWTDEHKSLVYYYGWWRYNSNYAGGDPYEARLYYYYARADYHFYSMAIDTSEYQSLQLNFLSYINHFSGQGLYALEAGYSHDGENWYAAWHEEPGASGSHEVSVPIEGGSETTYIGFWCKGNPYYFNYWYIDNVQLVAMGYNEEYTDFACQGDDLEPGVSRTFYLDQWTPDFLQYEETGQKSYIAQATIEVEGDMDPGNDIVVNHFDLDFWHDPALKEVTSPNDGNRAEILWENGEPDGRNGLAGSYYYGYSNILVDDFTLEADSTATGGDFSFVWNSGAGTGNLDTVKVYFFQNEGDCEPSMDEYAEVEQVAFSEETTGDMYFSRPEIVVTVEIPEVELPAGDWYVAFQPDSSGEDLGYMLTAESKGCEVMADLPYFGYPRWSSSSYLWGTEYDLAWALYGYSSGPPGINVYIQPGTESIDAVAVNYGTFQELDLICYAEIWEYITDPENGTKVYEDQIDNIDLDEPLGGEVALPFNDFTFASEGRYGLFLEMPAVPDDDDGNNKIRFGVAVDDTEPVSTHSITPPEPDGENGWYVNDVEVFLEAYDPLKMDVSSGVGEIKYQVNGGPVETISGSSGSFLLTQADDGNDVEIVYWAIDKVGNIESPSHSFTIDMDQTDPIIDLQYEVVEGNEIEGWLVEFTATATDETSGMDRVEFFLNEGWVSTVSGAGPEYKWSFRYYGDFPCAIRSDGYDIAGNMASDIVDPVEGFEFNQNLQLQQNQQSLQIK